MVQTASPPALPQDLQQLVDVWLEVERQTDILLEPLDDEQFNWAPASGVWSIAQCFDHLNTANALYMSRLQPAVDDALAAGHMRGGPIASTWFGRRFIASLQPPVRIKMKAPGKIVPAVRKRKAEVWPEFVRQHIHLRSFISERCGQVDLNTARFRNPFVPVIWMRAGTALGVMAAHDRRHLVQAQQIRQSPGFPRS